MGVSSREKYFSWLGAGIGAALQEGAQRGEYFRLFPPPKRSADNQQRQSLFHNRRPG